MTEPDRTMNWYLPVSEGGLRTVLLSHSDDRCQLLLTCGHWTRRISVVSSIFDFPMDPIYCQGCDDERYLDVQLQAVLLERRDRGIET